MEYGNLQYSNANAAGHRGYSSVPQMVSGESPGLGVPSGVPRRSSQATNDSVSSNTFSGDACSDSNRYYFPGQSLLCDATCSNYNAQLRLEAWRS